MTEKIGKWTWIAFLLGSGWLLAFPAIWLIDMSRSLEGVFVVLVPGLPCVGCVLSAFVFRGKIRRREYRGRSLALLGFLQGLVVVEILLTVLVAKVANVRNDDYAAAILVLLFAIQTLAVWVWMLVDCVRHERSDSDVFVAWLVSLIVFSPPAAWIYLIFRKFQRIPS